MNYHFFIVLSTLLIFFNCSKQHEKTYPVVIENFLIEDTINKSLHLEANKLYSFTGQSNEKININLFDSTGNIIEQYEYNYNVPENNKFYYYNLIKGTYRLQAFNALKTDDQKETSRLVISEESASTTQYLTKKQYTEDFDIFCKINEQANSGFYRYHTKSEIDSLIFVERNKINHNTTLLDFYNILWRIIDYTGSLHNELYFSKSQSLLLDQKEIFFPFSLIYINGKLYSNAEYKKIPIGAEILSINGINPNAFVEKVMIYRSTDGCNISGKYNAIETSWLPEYIYKAYGEKSFFKIKFLVNDKFQQIEVPSVKYDQFLELYKQRHRKKHLTQTTNSYSFKQIDSLQTGVLTVKSFSISDDEYDKYNLFLDSIFDKIKTNKHLILDIRGNGGGSGNALMLLTTYLINRDIKENIQAYTIFKKIPLSKYYYGPVSIEEYETGLNKYVTDEVDGKFFQNNDFNPTWTPNKKLFNGKIYLIIDPYVASAASHFAAHMKSDTNIIIVGNETAGGYYGHTGHAPIKYELPNSKLIVNFSIVNLEQDVSKLSNESFCEGIKPDYKIPLTYDDFINGKDSQLNFLFELIKNNK